MDPGLEPLTSGLSSHAWRVHATGGDSVLRMPVHPADGVGTYPIEHALLAELTEIGARVPAPILGSWQIPDWSLGPFSLASFLPGIPLRPESASWAAPQVATFLRQLHSLPISGHGPRAAHHLQLAGGSTEAEAGLLAAFAGQPMWPFGAAALAAHPALGDRPGMIAAIETHARAIRRAALAGPPVIVHSDLHEENILEDDHRLGFLDVGECFVGAAGWDFAALAYFGGWAWADQVLAAYPTGGGQPRITESVPALALCFGLFRWAQDLRLGVDGEAHNEAFLRVALARLSAG